MKKPKRFGTGEYMTVAVLGHDYRQSTQDLLNFEGTLHLLEKVEAMFEDEVTKTGKDSVSD